MVVSDSLAVSREHVELSNWDSWFVKYRPLMQGGTKKCKQKGEKGGYQL